jgi:hypothetical protein
MDVGVLFQAKGARWAFVAVWTVKRTYAQNKNMKETDSGNEK